jgi:hypothetical protein
MEFKFVEIKGQVLFKGKIILKMSKWDGVILKFSFQELLTQKSLNLHESFLT